jgi:hydroxyacylglutathione hydrolase
MPIGRLLSWIAAAFAIVVLGAALAAPYVDVELSPCLEPCLAASVIVNPAPPTLAAGAMVDDYWAVQRIDEDTIAIGEPRYYQVNYSYLILGRERALLFDSGTATRDIRPVVTALTSLPVTVMASHLHFDHFAGIAAFPSVAMIDLPETRADVTDGVFAPGRYEYLGMADHLRPPSVRVTQWIAPDGVIDLGGRQLTVLHTPGHTPSSVSLYDAAHRQLFAGDFVYPDTLYAFLPGASRSAYRATTRRLLSMLPPDTRLWTAHCCRANEKTSAPWLSVPDLADLDRALADMQSGRARSTGFFPRRFPVNGQMTIATGFAWNNR